MLGSRRFGAPAVDPDLPITPMLDMSFQLMAFFVFTFRPAPAEGQFSLSNTKDDIGLNAPIGLNQPETYIVHVEAARNGRIARLSLRLKDNPDIPLDLGTDLKKLQVELKIRYDALRGMPGKLRLEVEENMLHEYVMQLIDLGVQAGFTNVSAVPLDPNRR